LNGRPAELLVPLLRLIVPISWPLLNWQQWPTVGPVPKSPAHPIGQSIFVGPVHLGWLLLHQFDVLPWWRWGWPHWHWPSFILILIRRPHSAPGDFVVKCVPPSPPPPPPSANSFFLVSPLHLLLFSRPFTIPDFAPNVPSK
jgi:hypothetical protein